MDEKELKQVTDQINQKFDALNADIAKKSNVEQLEAKSAELRGMIEKLPTSEDVKKMRDQMDAMDVKMQTALMNVPGAGDSIEKQLEKALTSDGYKNAAKHKGASYEFSVKANELSTANSFTETNGPIIQRLYVPGVVSAPQRPTPIWDMISKVPISSDYAVMTERTSATIGAARTAEASGAFGQSYAAWTSYKYGVIKIGEYLKVAREKLEDWDSVRGEIMDMLTTNIPHIREGYFLTGYYATENWLGFINTTAQVAKDFAVPSGVIAVPNAGVADVLLVSAMQVAIGNAGSLANKQGYQANMAIVNPVDLVNLQAHKDINGQYVIPPFSAVDGTRVAGMRVVASNYMTAGKFLVGDFNQAKCWVSRALNVNMYDQNDTDALYDLVTFTASHRLAFGVGPTRAFAFVYGDISDGIAAVIAGNAS